MLVALPFHTSLHTGMGQQASRLFPHCRLCRVAVPGTATVKSDPIAVESVVETRAAAEVREEKPVIACSAVCVKVKMRLNIDCKLGEHYP